MSAPEHVGQWVVAALCTYAAAATVNRGVVGVALDAERSARSGWELTILGVLAVLFVVAAWGVYGWRRWAPYLTVLLFARLVYGVLRAGDVPPQAWLEVALFVTASLWFLLPDVRAGFRHGKWLF